MPRFPGIPVLTEGLTPEDYLLLSRFPSQQSRIIPVSQVFSDIGTAVNLRAYASHVVAGDWSPALQAAHDALPVGGTIHIPAGLTPSLKSRVVFSKSLALVGNGKTVLNVQTPVNVPSVVVANGDEALLLITGDDVTLDGLNFDGTSAPAGVLSTRKVCVYAQGGRNITVRNCAFTNLTRKGGNTAGGSGSLESDYAALYNDVTNGHIDHCTAKEVSGVFAYVNGSDGVWVNENHVEMLSDGTQHLYPIHFAGGNESVWAVRNRIKGGFRRSGGALDGMGTGLPNKRVYFVENIIDGCIGDASATAVIRLLATEGGHVIGNEVFNITSDLSYYIAVNNRDLPTQQPNPVGVIVAANILTCSGNDQRAIDVRADNPDATGGKDVTVFGNHCLSDGTHFFAAGIRMRDIARGKILYNTVRYKKSASGTAPDDGWGITFRGSLITPDAGEVTGNHVDCGGSANSRGIEVYSTTNPRVHANRVFSWGQFGLRLENTVVDASLTDNEFSGGATTTALSNLATGNTHRQGNRLGGATNGTATMLSGTNSFDVATAEAQTGDTPLVVLYTSSASARAVKVASVTAGVGFQVRTADAANVAADVQFAWHILH